MDSLCNRQSDGSSHLRSSWCKKRIICQLVSKINPHSVINWYKWTTRAALQFYNMLITGSFYDYFPNTLPSGKPAAFKALAASFTPYCLLSLKAVRASAHCSSVGTAAFFNRITTSLCVGNISILPLNKINFLSPRYGESLDFPAAYSACCETFSWRNCHKAGTT